MTISRRGLLAGIASACGAIVAGGLARTEALLAAGRDGRPIAVGPRDDDVRTATSFQAAKRDTTVLSFNATDGDDYRHSLDLGPDGIRAQRRGHWSHQSVVIDGAVRAAGAGAEAAAVGPMIVGEGDSMGVYGAALSEGTGVKGRGTVGIEGVGERGGVLTGDVAQLRLRPSELTSHPVRGEAGDLFVDAGRHLWFCRGGTDWSQLA
jgi:hypothetical protein